MKKFLLTLVLMVGIVLGLFAQQLTYQAVVRDNNQQLVVNTAVKATVTITFTTGTPATYSEEVNGTTNLHGLLSIEFGDETLLGRDWTDAIIAVKVVNSATSSIVYVNDEPRPVSAVPYALSVDGVAIQQYLTEHHYVDQTELDSRHYLTSDSTVITTMQGSLLQLSNKLDVQIAKMDSLAHVVDSLAKLPHGGGDTPTVEDTVFCYPNLGANTPETNKVTRGESFSLSTVTFTHPVETNWEIASWNTSADGSGTRYEKDATITPSGNITLYAQWHTFCTVSSVNSNEIGTTNRIDTLKDGENNKYTVVQINGQCWMKQNLRTSTISTGTIYTPAVGGYDVNTYGRLYDWTAVNVQDICPAGWHVPSNEEWTQLTNYVKGKSEYKCGSNIAKALASQTGWKDSSYDCAVGKDPSSNNATGFSAVPAGSTCGYGSGYDDFGKCAYFSSTTEKDDLNAYTSRLHVNSNSVTQDGSGKVYCKSVRCLRNTQAAPK